MRKDDESLENEVERLRNELRELKESEEKYRSAFKSSSDSLTISRVRDGQVVEINEGFTAITGYSWEDVAGKTAADIDLWVDPDQHKQLLQSLKLHGEIKGVETLLRTKKKQIIHCLISANIIQLRGEDHYLTITRNIDRLKKIQENLILAQELGKIGSWEMDWTTRKLSWSDQLYHFFQIDKSIAPDYGLFQKFIHPDDLEKTRQVLRNSIKNRSSYAHQHRVVLNNGKLRWVLETGRTIYNEEGKPIRSIGALQDITERKLANDSLITSQRLFQNLATSSPVGIFRTDEQGLTTYVNPKWCQLSGIARTDAMGDGWLRAVHPEDRKKLAVDWKELALQEGISVSKYRFLHPGGKIVYVKGQSVPEYDESNRIIGYVGTITDITEQVLASQVLEKAHNDLVQTLENMTDGFTSVDKDWYYLYVNKRAGEILGRNPADLIGKRVWDEFPEMKDTAFYLHSLEAMESRKSIAFENYYAPTQQWFENRLVPSAEGLSTFFQDITERKKAAELLLEKEALLAAIARNYPNSVVCVLNQKLEIDFISGRFLRDRGFNEEKFVHQSLKAVFDSYDINNFDDIKQLYEQAFDGKDVQGDIPLFNLHFVFYAMPLVREKGSVTKILAISEDVTQQKEIEKELKELNEELELKVEQRTEKLEKSEQAMLYLLEDMKDTQYRLIQANSRLKEINQELESFSYSVSHDLKAPLRAISGFAGFLKEDNYKFLSSDGKRLLDDIIKNAESMGKLIDGLLQLSRTGRKMVKRIDFDLSPVAFSVFSEQKKYYNLPKAVLTVADDLPKINADYTLVKQLFANLFSNALKYSSRRPEQKVELGWVKYKEKVVYFVKDNGIGFDMQYASKMFDTFHRLHSSKLYEGTGIGLSIVKRIVTKHGGEIWAEGKIDQGACVYFTFPKTNY